MAENATASSRANVLDLLSGKRGGRQPCFSGLISVVEPALESVGLHFAELHGEPTKMAVAAATTYRQIGFESAVVPLDMCVEAEALGAQVDFRESALQPEFPRVVAPLADSSSDLTFDVLSDLVRRGRIAVVAEAIRNLVADVGQEIAVGAWVPGPFTLAAQLVHLTNLVVAVRKAPESVARVLDLLTGALVEVAAAYRSAGADFITVHEMGGSPGFIGPPAFSKLVLPRLQRLLAALPALRVLSVCGNTNHSMPLLAEAGADAISIDQTNDLARSRATLGDEAILLGNLDPIGTLANGSEVDVRRAVANAIEAGADAIWPGCDLWPRVPAANMRSMVEAARQLPRQSSGLGE